MNNTKHTRRTRRTALAAAAFLAVFIGNTPTARAATRTWDGDTSVTWTDGANWGGGTAPVNDLTSDIANFNLATYGGNPVFAPTAPNLQKINGITIGGSNGAMTITTGTTTNRLQIGSGGITMTSGAGALSLGTTVSAGVLIAANQTWTNDSSSALGWNTIGTPNSSGNLTLTLSGTGSGGFSQLQNGITQGTSSTLAIVVDYAGSGTVSMTRTSNTFSGGLTIKQGTVLVNQDNSTGAGTVTLGVNGGAANATLTSANAGSARSYASAFVLAAGHTGNLTIASTGAGASTFGATFTGGVTGTNNLIVDATSSNANQPSIQFTTNGLNFTGNLTKRGDKTASLAAANTFGGIALVEAGTLRLDHVNALQNATLDTGTSGAQAVTFNLVGANTYNLGGLQGADALAIGNNTISVGANNASTTFSGAISGTDGILTKVGSGTLTLSASNGYTGATTVSAGTLLIAAGGNLSSSSAISVSAGATMNNANGGSLTGALTLQEGAALTTSAASSGFAPTSLTLTGDLTSATWSAIALTNTAGSGLTKGGAFTLSLTNITAGTYNLTSGSGFSGSFTSANVNGNTLTASGSDWVGSNIGGFDYTYTNIDNQLVISAIPEPSTWALLAFSLTTVMVLRRRRH